MSASGTSRKKYVKQGKSGLRGYANSARWRDCRTAEHAREGLVRHLRGIDPAFEVDLPLCSISSAWPRRTDIAGSNFRYRHAAGGTNCLPLDARQRLDPMV